MQRHPVANSSSSTSLSETFLKLTTDEEASPANHLAMVLIEHTDNQDKHKNPKQLNVANQTDPRLSYYY